MPTRMDNAKTLLDNLLTAVILMDERLCIHLRQPGGRTTAFPSANDGSSASSCPICWKHISLDLQRFKQCLISGRASPTAR